MYAKEMRGGQTRWKGDAGGGDGPSSSPEKTSREGKSSSDAEDFLFGYGNYGDPHAFAPYQLFLLLLDFVFNWTIDLTHEDPLAVLVIFVFQSLAIIINLILYIMASANQAMQAGLHRRVTVHHWLNLCTCLLYIILTGWWFIWALRKSWPSVSDQFSFTWPASGLQPASNASSPPPSLAAANATRRLTTGNSSSSGSAPHPPGENEVIKEHYTLWSDGFIALYVCHRTLAILYYFIYMRATFLVLNTPDMDRFAEKKKNLVARFWEVKQGEKGGKRGSVKTRGSSSDGGTSAFSLGLQEYLASSSKFLMESEAHRQSQGHDKPEGTVKNKTKRQILWADDGENDVRMGTTSARPKAAKPPRKRPSEEATTTSTFEIEATTAEDDTGGRPDVQRKKDKLTRSQSEETRVKHGKKGERRRSREEVEDDTE